MSSTDRRAKAIALELLVALVSVLLALAIGALMIALEGHDPFEAYGVMFEEALGQPLGLGQVLFKTTTLTFTGVAAAFAFRAGMFNIGGEGQLYLGAFFSALVGIALPSGTPALIALPMVILAAALGGVVAAAVPAVLKATRGTHEVISTMMMNFVLLAVVNWWLGTIRVTETVRTRAVAPGARLPLLSGWFEEMRGADGNAALFIAVLAIVAVHYFFERTRSGYELRVVGKSPRAAEYGAVSVARATMISLMISGGLAGLGGINFVLGSPGYFEQNFAPYQGFMGIAVALLARNHPLGALPAAFMFALLSEGGQAIQQFVPKEIGEILQAVVIIFVVVGARILDRALIAAQKGKTA